jgi:hypothetical protein
MKKLTSELNRINQEIEERRKQVQRGYNVKEGSEGIIDEKIADLELEKETLKRVSLMWANEVLDKMRMWVGGFKDEVQEIKSLMEKA